MPLRLSKNPRLADTLADDYAQVVAVPDHQVTNLRLQDARSRLVANRLAAISLACYDKDVAAL